MRRRHRHQEMSMDQAWGELQQDFDINNASRYLKTMTGVSAMGSSADYHYRNEVQYLRGIERARLFDRNNMVIGSGITRVVDNVLQDGFGVDPQTGSDELDAALAERWEEWATDADQCDAAGEQTFAGIAGLALRSVIVDGDIVELPRADGTLEAVEGHRLRTSKGTRRNVVHGVLLNEDRRRLEYWLCRQDLNPHSPSPKLADIKIYKTRDRDGNRQVFHVYNPRRVSQTRGVSALAPVVFPAGMHDDLQFAQLVRAQVAACYSVFRERDIAFQGDLTNPQRGEQTTETLGDGSTRHIEGIAPGMEITGEPGEKLIGFAPNVPNPEFFEHATMILSIIAVNLGIPVQLLLLDATKTNFSGWRGAMDQARIGFRRIQQWLIGSLHRPVYLWKVRQWLAADAGLRALAGQEGVRALKHRWNAPGWNYIEPVKDVRADREELEGNLISPRRQKARRGHDWDEVAEEIVADRVTLIRAALLAAKGINTEFIEAEIDWREIVHFVPTSKPAPAPEPEPGPEAEPGPAGDKDDADD